MTDLEDLKKEFAGMKSNLDLWVKDIINQQKSIQSYVLDLNHTHSELLGIMSGLIDEIALLRLRVLSLEMNNKMNKVLKEKNEGGDTKWDSLEKRKKNFFTRIVDRCKDQQKVG